MKVKLRTADTLDQFIAENAEGKSIALSADGSAVGPMQAVLMAMAGCSTIDVIMILKKMKQDVVSVEVEVESERRKEIPKTFTAVNLHFLIKGKVKKKKVEQAIKLSLEKYCSVSMMIEKSAKISSSYEIVGTAI